MLIDLTKQPWQLAGWRPNAWMLRQSTEITGIHVPEVGPVPARIPASVQHLLHEANVIHDWNVGTNCCDNAYPVTIAILSGILFL